jgi:HutD
MLSDRMALRTPLPADPPAPPILAHIRRSDWRTMPWKNGGGITHELWREGEGAEGWALRLSMAEVSLPGPFSRFPGVNRVILLLKGAGFVLRRSDGVIQKTTQVGSPFPFLGEDDWYCELVDGPVLDFNLMFDRDQGHAALWAQQSGEVFADFFLCLDDGKVAGVDVAPLDLLRLQGVFPSTASGIAIRWVRQHLSMVCESPNAKNAAQSEVFSKRVRSFRDSRP